MTDDKLKLIEEYARTLPNPIFAMDVEQLVAEVRRLRAERKPLTECRPEDGKHFHPVASLTCLCGHVESI